MKELKKFNDSFEERKTDLKGRKEMNFSNLGPFKFDRKPEQTVD